MVQRFIKYAPYLLLVFGLLIRLPEIWRPVWADEQITLDTLNINPASNPFYNGVTTNLPLYFWIVSFVHMIIPLNDVVTLRLFGIILNLVNGYLLYKWIISRSGRGAGTLLLALFVFSPLQIHYSAELRPYVLTQLLASLLIIYLFDKRLRQAEVVAGLGVLTHYSFYIFFAAVTILYVYKRTRIKDLVKIVLVPLTISAAVMFIYFSNPLFWDSVDGMELHRSGSGVIKSLISVNSVERIKEVVSDYYFYGLYYYRIDNFAQFVLKKLLLFVLIISAYLAIWRSKDSSISLTLTRNILSILFLCLFISLIGEKLGYYPFGGRHIMPYSFLLLIIISIGIWNLYVKAGFLPKISAIAATSLIIVPLILFQTCSQVFRDRYLGTSDPQGDIFTYCVKNVPYKLQLKER